MKTPAIDLVSLASARHDSHVQLHIFHLICSNYSSLPRLAVHLFAADDLGLGHAVHNHRATGVMYFSKLSASCGRLHDVWNKYMVFAGEVELLGMVNTTLYAYKGCTETALYMHYMPGTGLLISSAWQKRKQCAFIKRLYS